MRKLIVVSICLAMAFAGYLLTSTVDSAAPVAVAAAKGYTATMYVSGMGGHFAVAEITIDPSDKDNPIKITKDLDRIVLGSSKSYPVHDPRIDDTDRTKMFFSTYKPDPAADGMVHIGVVDLATKTVAKDLKVKIDDRGAWTGAVYCASGQTKKSYIPVTMTGEAYIDVFRKSDLSLAQRVFLDKEGFKNNYWFYHGTNSPDMKTFVVAVNGTEKWPDAKTPGKPNGKVDMLLLDMASLENGKVKVVKKNSMQGEPGKTLTFRQYFTADGKYILQSAADRFYLLDAKTLKVLDEEVLSIGENHDAMGTPDGKYAILSLRSKVRSEADPESGKLVQDGQLALYDIAAKKVVGNPVSVCYACHKTMGLHNDSALCGIDANFKM
jgi:hypothetical protein